jgi:hypothetical protein
MAIAVEVKGAVAISVGTGSADALESLGYSMNGVTYIEEAFYDNVMGDQNGGDAGPPIEIQVFGQIHRVRMELTKWDEAVADKIRARANDNGSTTAGSFGLTPGSLLFAGGYGYRLVCNSANDPRNYLFAIPRQPIEMNAGSKHSRLILEWECHAVSGVLYNATVS